MNSLMIVNGTNEDNDDELIRKFNHPFNNYDIKHKILLHPLRQLYQKKHYIN